MAAHANQNTNAKKERFSFKTYVKETNLELKRVTWPTKGELLKSTGVVLTVCILSTILVWAVDSILSGMLKLILK